jgi:hypothetical protein
MHCALTVVQAFVTRTPEQTHWLDLLFWGLLNVTKEKWITTEMSYSDARSLVTFFWGFILWQQGTCFSFAYDLKVKEHQNTKLSDLYFGDTPIRKNLVASCFDALSITLFGDISIENELNRIPTNAQCVNWSAGIWLPHCHSMIKLKRACWLATFFLGFTYYGDRDW